MRCFRDIGRSIDPVSVSGRGIEVMGMVGDHRRADYNPVFYFEKTWDKMKWM